jgi:5'-methylthioinosine phosphorylase
VAEIDRMARDGCTLVGMTGMPEAGLARERGLPYAMLSLVVNPAAGRAVDPFDLDAIYRVMASGMESAQALLQQALAAGL